MGQQQKGWTMLKHSSATWKTEDENWMKNGNVCQKQTQCPFLKNGCFLVIFHLISGSIFHPIFLKNAIKNEIKNGSKMRTVNTPIVVCMVSCCVSILMLRCVSLEWNARYAQSVSSVRHLEWYERALGGHGIFHCDFLPRTLKFKFLAVLTVSTTLTFMSTSPLTPNEHAQPMGINVSSYQPNINWATVKENGLTFAFIKATEGTSKHTYTFSVSDQCLMMTAT